MHGDRDLLIELTANLIDNAIKFTPSGGRFEIGVRASGRHAALRIINIGPDTPAAERDAVPRRFYRSDKSSHIEDSGLADEPDRRHRLAAQSRLVPTPILNFFSLASWCPDAIFCGFR